MTVVVKERPLCAHHTEAQYYSSVLVHFPPVCYYCGQGEEALFDDEEIRNFKLAMP